MKSILDEISYIRDNDDFKIDYNNCNRYRVVLREKNGTKTAYYFSCPIYNQRSKRIVDFRFNQSNGEIYAIGSNANITLSNTIRMENAEGFCEIQPQQSIRSYSGEQVFYGLDEVYPTANGIAYNASLNGKDKFSFFIEVSIPFLNTRTTNKFFALMSEQFKPFVTLSCIGSTNVSNDIIAPAKLEYEKINDKKYKVTLLPTNQDAKGVLFEINLYERKLFQDTTVESGNPSDNNAFGSVAFIGKTELFGDQWLYSRVDYDRISEMIEKHINKVVMHIPLHNKTIRQLKVYKVSQRFCSFGSNWENKILEGNLIANSNIINNYQTIDITTLLVDSKTKKLITSNGLILKSEAKDGDFAIISTADSSYAPQILEINYK